VKETAHNAARVKRFDNIAVKLAAKRFFNVRDVSLFIEIAVLQWRRINEPRFVFVTVYAFRLAVIAG
jgi:hypothetical protein